MFKTTTVVSQLPICQSCFIYITAAISMFTERLQLRQPNS